METEDREVRSDKGERWGKGGRYTGKRGRTRGEALTTRLRGRSGGGGVCKRALALILRDPMQLSWSQSTLLVLKRILPNCE